LIGIDSYHDTKLRGREKMLSTFGGQRPTMAYNSMKGLEKDSLEVQELDQLYVWIRFDQ
jgi:hypothetical protein